MILALDHAVHADGTMRAMNEALKEIFDRVLKWPAERQEDVLRVLQEMEAQDASPYWLTPEQEIDVEKIREDVRSGRADTVTAEQMRPIWKISL